MEPSSQRSALALWCLQTGATGECFAAIVTCCTRSKQPARAHAASVSACASAGAVGATFGAGIAFVRRQPLRLLAGSYGTSAAVFGGTVFGASMSPSCSLVVVYLPALATRLMLMTPP